MISIIHPSRGRPDIAFNVAMKWISNAGCDVQYLLSLDSSDERILEYRGRFGNGIDIIVKDNRSAIEAINNAAFCALGDIIIQIADDFQCFPNWGNKIESIMNGKKDWVLKTQDGIQDWIITLPIMDKIYYERFHYIYNPAYKHSWSDTELTCVAELTGCKQVSAIMFKHLNEGETKIVDEVSKKNDATFEDGRALFIDRKKNKFGLSIGDIRGTLTPNFYTLL